MFHVMPCGQNPATKLPCRGRDADGNITSLDSVGYDIFAPTNGSIDALSRKMVDLGFATAFKPGLMAKVLDRSGMGSKGITVLAGIMDPDYRGEWKVILYNTNGYKFDFSAGDRICQVVFVVVELPVPEWVSELEPSLRGTKGIGSSGK